MNMIKNLSVNICKKYPDFKRTPEKDWRFDWGGYERYYDYKGLEIGTTRAEGVTRLDIYPDLSGVEFTDDEWFAAGGRELTTLKGEEIDLDELIENCEKILALIPALDEKARNDVPDMFGVLLRIVEEKGLIENAIYKARTELKWWTLDKWELENARHFMQDLEKDLAELKGIVFEDLSRREKKRMFDRVAEYNYVVINEGDYSLRRLVEITDESNAAVDEK